MRRQGQVFEFFLQLAERRRLPVIVHSRLAVNEVLETLTRFDLRTVLLHWYDGPIEKLRLIEDRGYLISIGPVTLYSPRTCELARKAGLGMILTETDGPVAYGGQFKGRMTKPSFVIDVVQKFAEIKSISMDVAQDALLNNFRKLVSA